MKNSIWFVLPFLAIMTCKIFAQPVLPFRDSSDPALHPVTPGKSDRFPNFAELRAANVEGVDYRVTALDRQSNVLVLAIHGGIIEPPVDEMARLVAGEDLNLYTFEALEGSRGLHLTATHFDDPRAVDLASRSQACVSLHGYRDSERRGVCLGGLNDNLRNAMEAAIRRVDPTINVYNICIRYPANHPQNIANRCTEAGVQLEMSSLLREEFREDQNFLKRFSGALRSAIFSQNP